MLKRFKPQVKIFGVDPKVSTNPDDFRRIFQAQNPNIRCSDEELVVKWPFGKGTGLALLHWTWTRLSLVLYVALTNSHLDGQSVAWRSMSTWPGVQGAACMDVLLDFVEWLWTFEFVRDVLVTLRAQKFVHVHRLVVMPARGQTHFFALTTTGVMNVKIGVALFFCEKRICAIGGQRYELVERFGHGTAVFLS